MKRALNANQKAFAREYIKSGNATQSYLKVYECSYETANAEGSVSLGNPSIQAVIQDHYQKAQDRHDGLLDRVIKELEYLGFSRVGDFVQFNDEGLEFRDLEALDDSQAAAIHSVESRTTTDDKGNTIREHRFKLHDKIKALDLLAKHLGGYQDKGNEGNKTINVFNGLTIINSSPPPSIDPPGKEPQVVEIEGESVEKPQKINILKAPEKGGP